VRSAPRATSADIEDNADILRLRQSLDLLISGWHNGDPSP
jgi:adenylosuccinate lyase